MPSDRLPGSWFDPADDPADPLARVRPWPEPVSTDDVPEALRDNPLVRAYLALTPEQEGGLARLAASDARDDEAVAAALVASVR
jgi:hypothetical protein